MHGRVDPITFGKRKAKRNKVFEPAVLVQGQSELRAHILDLSATGALCHCEEPQLPGLGVTLRFGGLNVLGRSAWVNGKQFGIAFLTPLDDVTLNRLLRIAPHHAA